MNVLIILGISVVLLLFIFVLVAHHRGISDRARLDRSALLATGSSVAERIKPCGQISVAAAEVGYLSPIHAGVPDAPTDSFADLEGDG